MSSLSPVVTVTPMRRDARGLILLRAEKATDYFSFCEEKGCDWEGLLNSIPEKLDHSAFITLPQSLVKPGTCASAAGVEVPLHYNKPLPEGYEMISLVPCTLLYFQGMPFDEQAYCQAIDIVTEAVANYDFGRYGFTLNCENALYFNFGDARIAVTVNM